MSFSYLKWDEIKKDVKIERIPHIANPVRIIFNNNKYYLLSQKYVKLDNEEKKERTRNQIVDSSFFQIVDIDEKFEVFAVASMYEIKIENQEAVTEKYIYYSDIEEIVQRKFGISEQNLSNTKMVLQVKKSALDDLYSKFGRVEATEYISLRVKSSLCHKDRDTPCLTCRLPEYPCKLHVLCRFLPKPHPLGRNPSAGVAE